MARWVALINLVVALINLIKRQCPEKQVQEMRDKLYFEGWNTYEHFPEGWNVKFWEGNTKGKKLYLNTYLVSREGVRLESFKSELSYMEESPNYSQADLDLVQKFKKAKSVNLRRRGYELEEGDHTLPPGQKRRPQVG